MIRVHDRVRVNGWLAVVTGRAVMLARLVLRLRVVGNGALWHAYEGECRLVRRAGGALSSGFDATARAA